MTSETKTCQNCKQNFVIEPEDFLFYEKIKVPTPSFCPSCRYQRRLANRNEWSFYKRKCSLCGKEMVSIYNPDYPGPVYCQTCFWSDNWDRYAYGREFDFSRPFFEQFQELRLSVPHVAMANWLSVNSEYTNQCLENKNCYMCVSCSFNENCLYGYWTQKSRECVDCYEVEQCELLYECLNCFGCSRSAYLQDCADCLGSFFLKDCWGCTSCFGSYGLRNKSYYWKNEPLSKEEYEKRFSEFVFSRDNIKKEREALKTLGEKFPHKYYHGRNNINSSGDYISDAKEAKNVFNAKYTEFLRHCQDTWWSKDSMDSTEVFSELGYELEGVDARSCIAMTKTVSTYDSYYSELCTSSHDIFGCVGLKMAEYAILNRSYEKEECHKLVEKIIAHMKETGEWGEFFPARMSLFAYNETVAQDYFPLQKEEAIGQGLRWYERGNREYKVSISPEQVPQTIKEVDSSILQETIGCISQSEGNPRQKYANCATAFRITEMELELYHKVNIPIPQKCSPCRRRDRLELRNPRKLYNRPCQCAGKSSENLIYQNTSEHLHGLNHCPNKFETTYAPERPEIVYCEACYQSEVQ